MEAKGIEIRFDVEAARPMKVLIAEDDRHTLEGLAEILAREGYETIAARNGMEALFSHAWGGDHLPNSRTLDQHISQLRKRIEVDPKNPRIILTVHGVGYRCEG